MLHAGHKRETAAVSLQFAQRCLSKNLALFSYAEKCLRALTTDASICQVKFQLKKVLCMGVAVGNVGMTPDELRHVPMSQSAHWMRYTHST